MSENINNLKKLLEKSSKPLLIIGNGVKLSNSDLLIKKFIKKTGIPYAPTWATIDIFDSKDKHNAGTFGVAATRYGNFAIQNADLLIFMGARMSPQILGSNPNSFSPKSNKVIIDIDENEFKNHRLPKIKLKINSNIKDVLNSLNKLTFKFKNFDKWQDKIVFYKRKFPITSKINYQKSKFIDPYAFFSELSKVTRKNDIVIPDASANLIWCLQALSVSGKEKVFTALNHSPMGYSVPASVGAYLANKNSRVIATIGDGSMQMNIQELETIQNYNINVKIFILNNQGYGLIKQTQETWLDSNYAGVDKSSGLSLPNYIKLAKAYKIKTVEMINNSNLNKRLDKILKMKGPVVVDVKIHPKKRVEPKIDFGAPLHDMSPKLNKKFIKKLLLD
jgi:acetolactate synthase-1/2/3 large subunit